MYEYKATVTRVVDGDTVHADIDLGFGIIYRDQVLRLARINAPELKKSEGRGEASRDHLKLWVEGKEVVIRTTKDRREKYGRYLAEVLVNVGGVLISMNDDMLEGELARPAKY
jgi:micrococcal nuclease